MARGNKNRSKKASKTLVARRGKVIACRDIHTLAGAVKWNEKNHKKFAEGVKDIFIYGVSFVQIGDRPVILNPERCSIELNEITGEEKILYTPEGKKNRGGR